VNGGPLVIVGDALLDRDVYGHAGRLCPDAPAPVVEAPHGRERPGGAALAALLAGQYGGEDTADVILVAPLGADPASQTVRGLLPDTVRVVPLPLSGALQEKTRVVADGSTLLRLDTPAPVPGPAGREAADVIRGAGALLVSDYGQGITASRAIRSALADRGQKVPLVWDPHPRGTNPVPGTLLATPNEPEAAAAAARSAGGRSPGGAFRDAAAAADRLLARWPAQAIAVTRGARGALLARRGQPPLAIPAPPVGGGDPCGAGDMFAVAAATALRGGALVSEAVTWAVDTASRYVAAGGASRLGAEPGAQARAAAGRPEEPTAARPPSAARAGLPPGGVLVAAGGCFDVLHAGHVSMLRAARALGDGLLVCINSDASVRRLKGPGRPLNPAADRAAVLRALDCVDDVVVFDEDTPERLLGELRPDIWVKGGDYDGRELPEEAVLRRWGGMAVTVPYLDGRSTTRIAAAAALAARQRG
jgi:D-beta-D-heptose 7-phosphate kinase / D-beta-D-heptose 1-phosphate adenosyltransferase